MKKTTKIVLDYRRGKHQEFYQRHRVRMLTARKLYNGLHKVEKKAYDAGRWREKKTTKQTKRRRGDA